MTQGEPRGRPELDAQVVQDSSGRSTSPHPRTSFYSLQPTPSQPQRSHPGYLGRTADYGKPTSIHILALSQIMLPEPICFNSKVTAYQQKYATLNYAGCFAQVVDYNFCCAPTSLNIFLFKILAWEDWGFCDSRRTRIADW